jgi:hypothetical protein
MQAGWNISGYSSLTRFVHATARGAESTWHCARFVGNEREVKKPRTVSILLLL